MRRGRALRPMHPAYRSDKPGIAPDESRIYRVTALADGVIRSVASQSASSRTRFLPSRDREGAVPLVVRGHR
jgi:hypothetical protein